MHHRMGVAFEILRRQKRNSLSADLNLFLSGYGKLAAFGSSGNLPGRYVHLNQVRLNGAVFSGIEISRNAGIRIGVRFEHLVDTGIPVKPRSSNLLSLAVQGMSTEVFY